MTAGTDMMKLWFWPLEAARVAGRLMETVMATQSVLAARIPIIGNAAANPLEANHRELTLMISEKVEALGRSEKSVSRAGEIVRQASNANAHAFSRAAGTGFITPMEWFAILERNLAVAATIMELPMKAMAPIHKGVTSNARRLRRI